MLERNYTIPLRRTWLKVPRYQRSRKAIRAIGEFVSRHMKSENVKIGVHLNEHVWQNGMKNPPSRVEVMCKKEDDGKCYVELKGYQIEEVKEAKEEKKIEEVKNIKEEEEKETAEELNKKAIEGVGEHPKKEKGQKSKFHQKKETIKSKESQIIGRTQKNT